MKKILSLIISLSLLFSCPTYTNAATICLDDLYSVSMDGRDITKIYFNNELVWTAGTEVTYMVNGVAYKDYFKIGESVLSPISFSPEEVTTIGSFIGWTTETNGTDVVETLIADRREITLYALSKIDIIKDCVPDETYIVSSGLIDCPVQSWYNETHYYGFWSGCNGATTGFSAEKTITLDGSLLGKRICYNSTFMLHNGIFNGNNKWWGTISNNGNKIVDYQNPSFPSNYYYTNNGDFILENTTISLSVGLNRGYNSDQATQPYSSGIGFTNLYAVGVFE